MIVDNEKSTIRLDDDMNQKAAIGLPGKIANAYPFSDAPTVYEAIRFADLVEAAYAEKSDRKDATPAEQKTHWQQAADLQRLVSSKAMAELVALVPDASLQETHRLYRLEAVSDPAGADSGDETTGVVLQLRSKHKFAQDGGHFPGKAS